MSSKIVVDAIESNSASTPAITLDSSGTGVYKATSVETSNIKHASSSSNNIVLASDGSVKTTKLDTQQMVQAYLRCHKQMEVLTTF